MIISRYVLSWVKILKTKNKYTWEFKYYAGSVNDSDNDILKSIAIEREDLWRFFIN